MSIEADAQRDLSLNPEDAENVVGGKKETRSKAAPKKATAKKSAVKKPAAKAAVGHSLPMVNIQQAVTPVEGNIEATDDCE